MVRPAPASDGALIAGSFAGPKARWLPRSIQSGCFCSSYRRDTPATSIQSGSSLEHLNYTGQVVPISARYVIDLRSARPHNLRYVAYLISKPSMIPARAAAFGPYSVDLRSGQLRKFGVKVKMGEQPFQILLRLLETPGELVTREELRARLWADDTFVDFDHGLNSAIQRLRDSLSDNAEMPLWIETVPRRGYRFVGHVEWSGPPRPRQRTRMHRRRLRVSAPPQSGFPWPPRSRWRSPPSSLALDGGRRMPKRPPPSARSLSCRSKIFRAIRRATISPTA
jgi:DNA-binding winged helix-turn-helix (wHTH) protein